MIIRALEVNDERAFEVASAGPAALLVAKLLKIVDRAGAPSRLEDKDALDVLRLLRATTTEDLASRPRRLGEEEVSRPVTEQALRLLAELFARPEADGSQMAARATSGLEDAATITASCAALASELLEAVR